MRHSDSCNLRFMSKRYTLSISLQIILLYFKRIYIEIEKEIFKSNLNNV